jgi:hypothetical protein
MPDDTIPAKPAEPTLTLGRAIDKAWALREKKRAKEAEIKAVEAEIEAMETLIIAKLDAEDTDSGRGKLASASVGETICFTISDFDAFTRFVRRKNYFHLLQRRVSDLAVRELYQGNKVVPGLTPFKRRRLNLTTLQQPKK